MWPVKPPKDMWSNGSAMLIQHKMSKKQKQVPQEDDKNCQSKKCYGSKCSDKNCQENENISMWPVKAQMDVCLKKPAELQSSYKKKDELKYVYEDKNCQDTICDKKQKKIDKNHQTSDMLSVTNTNDM